MIKIEPLLSCIFSILICSNLNGAELSLSQRLDKLPLPAGITVERDKDIAKDPAFEFSKKHRDLQFFDPFSTERMMKKPLPETASIRFTTKASSREIYLFYKRFFNVESNKRDADKLKPYYSSLSMFSFDQKNEADVTKDLDIGDATFYSIEARSGNDLLNICILNQGGASETTVFLIASIEKD
jgi:hypothetical protein